jgi:hypothetical protein
LLYSSATISFTAWKDLFDVGFADLKVLCGHPFDSPVVRGLKYSYGVGMNGDVILVIA